MATVKVSLSQTACPGSKKFPVIIEVAHYGIKASVKTPFAVLRKNFDFSLEEVITTPNCRISQQQAREMNMLIRKKTDFIRGIIDDQEKEKNRYTPEQIIRIYSQREESHLIADYVDNMICKGYIRKSTGEMCKALLIQIAGFSKDKKKAVCFDEITYKWLVDFQVYLHSLNYTPHMVNTYIRVLHRICNMARRSKAYVVTPDPFRYQFRSSNKSGRHLKTAANQEYIDSIRLINLDEEPEMAFARDLFLFGYYANGLSFKNIFLLKKKDVLDNVILYSQSRKSRRVNCLKITPRMRELMQKYCCEGEYVFPIMENRTPDIQDQYKLHLRRHNDLLRKLMKMLGIPCSLSLKKTNRQDMNTWEQEIEIVLLIRGKEKQVCIPYLPGINIMDSVKMAISQFSG